MFQPIGKKITLSQEIEQKIEASIIQKKFNPGEKLPTENELCDMFAVSRTALREALRMLSGRGLITIRKGSGIYVNDYSKADVTRPMSLYLDLNFDKKIILDVIQIRKTLEPLICEMAAKNRKEVHIQQLEKNIKNFKACKIEDYNKESHLDFQFHTIITQASGNTLIPIMMEPLLQQMPKIRLLVYKKIDQAKSSALDYHLLIYNMIVKQDAQGAFEAMKEHMRIAEKHSRAIVNQLD
ncbi:MAG: FadR family transcriptional regulator [Calditrichaeota bacterium]|nr:MAG: FadR family transcriptional regulator [Calditrichota bacterium]MBL1208104.1 FadR family transcriptional regulator [Calditrichota bacterium]NOG47942.1 FadR family transcriptional regulator [Calditrichota bacterium]